MTEAEAKEFVRAHGGEAYQSGGNIWLVLTPQEDGTLEVASDECEAIYASREAFENGEQPISVVYS